MMPLEVPQAHAIRKLELTYRLMFLLRDLGIKSAIQPSIDSWDSFMAIQSYLMLNELPDSQ